MTREVVKGRSTRLMLAAVAALTVLGFVVTLSRVPVPRNESQLYASIARSLQLSGVGVPSTLWFAASPVDHIPFYGPVYFALVAGTFSLFGVSLASSRIISLLGALLVVTGGAVLASRLSRARDRWLWAVTLLLMTPELGAAATRGDMEPIAVGFEIMALAVFVAGLTGSRRRYWHGAAAGVLLTLAALTTPRTYPFVFAFVVSGIWLFVVAGHDREARRQFIASAMVLLVGMCGWATWASGSPIGWVRYITFILSHEDTDVAILSTAIRWWQFSWLLAITPFFATLGGVVAATSLIRRHDQATDESRAGAFALLTAGVGGVLTFYGMNLTFLFGGYFALPLFAVVLALPHRGRQIRPLLFALGVSGLLVCDLGATALKYVRIAATWDARDPRPIDQFVRNHVPDGAEVTGPDWLYFFAVEGNGAHYLSASQKSVADWTRWVPIIEPAAAHAAPHIPLTPPAARFLIWAVGGTLGDPLPDGYACARDHLVAMYRPPPQHLDRLGSLGHVWDVGYPDTALYRLPSGCPAGF